MTDSMKFGPEWLRNMSTDSTANTSLGSGGISSGGGGGVSNSSPNNSSTFSAVNVGGGSGGNVSSSYHYGNSSAIAAQLSTSSSSSGQRQFRYGREELLSIFDKNCNMPEILPGYKKLFVEKVQVPLALTPSTDEEIFAQTSAVPTQRPAWVRRSPVGFTPSLRGTGRGGSVDRGRMRGKSVYHPIYQRPTPMFEDDVRLPVLKPERSWSERNGAGDALVAGGSGSVGIGSDWNGTPASSPRKEFSSHSRNMENWRKNRTEEGSGDASTSSLVGADGWRGSTSFGNTHRWGRSTSWRDEDAASNNADGYTGSGITMQRSYSTISTTVSERGGYASNIVLKSSSLSSTSGYSNNHPIANRQANSSSGTPSGRGNQWTTPSGDPDDNLPEWAMENPSDSGGTFDASGAFHGSVDEDDPANSSKEYQFAHKKDPCKDDCLTSTITNCKDDVLQEEHENANSSSTEKSAESSSQEIELTEIYVDKESLSNEKPLQENELQFSEEQTVHSDKLSETNDDNSSPNMSPQIKSAQANSVVPNASETLLKPTTIGSTTATATTTATQQLQSITSHSDLSDRMQEVADDMVEKLIMDDDSIGISNNGNKNIKPTTTSTGSNNMNMPNTFVAPVVAALLKQTVAQQQQQQVSQNIGTSPSLPNLAGHKVMPLFGGGIVVDHATMQQHNLQQQQLAAASAAANLQSSINSGTTDDLWYYRDPQSKVQGPFTANEMTEWYRAGYFDENLYVRRVCDARFRALGELIKLCHGNMPFTHTHLIPVGLDNVNMVPNADPIRQVRDKPQGISEFGINQQQDQREELKGNVMAAADSLSAAVKNLINPVDMSQMLNMHFQMLQEQYLRHQEMLVVAEFSNKECFQRLTPSEREAAVRQKVQILGLPEYLTSLAGLSNSLSTLNPTAGNQFYDVIAECSKKEQHFAGAPQPQSQQQQQTVSNPFLDADDFILSAQKQQQQPTQFANVPYSSVVNNENGSAGNVTGGSDDISTNDLIHDFNLRMLLRGGNINSPQSQQRKTPTDYGASGTNDFLTQQQLMVAASQSPALQMWIPQLGTGNVQQPQFLPQQATQASNQWTGGPLVHMINSSISGAPMTTIAQNKATPASMWDVLPLEQVQNPNQFQSNVLNFNVQSQQKTTPPQQATQEPHQPLSEQENFVEPQINPPNLPQHDAVVKTQQLLASEKSRKEDQSEKQQPQNQHHTSIKRPSNKSQPLSAKGKEDTLAKKQTEEDRRREQAEEKRRQKEEKKRQQAEEEKRRSQQIEEEKRRQILEEKERQQQIQAQRRKAMLGNSINSATANINANKSIKDQQRVQSSIAPWSAQTTSVVGTSGPSLAEIQKAERRERRADQRQMEILEKQLRATNTAAAEINDSFLKWNASPVPVKSFAEIQAEEAKRLASELLDMQRRKEQEQQSSTIGANVNVSINPIGAGVNSSNLSAIWSGSKVWGSTSNAGFWEEPIKFSAALATNNNATILTSSTAGRPQQTTQQKPQTSTNQQQNVASSNRNLTKSQTVSTMQNTSSLMSGSSNKNIQQPNSSSVSVKQSQKQQQQQKLNLSTEKKGIGKNQTLNTPNNNIAALNKKDDYQNEFTGWCMKSLSGMNTKVDVPTFVTFLQDLESPYEVKDYVRMYLGEGKEFTEFAKQFLERRSKYKNLQRAQNAHNDDMCKPAPAITPSGNDSLDNRGKQKKVKKNKMTKLDARILGFSVTAAEGRINVGDRDYVDAP